MWRPWPEVAAALVAHPRWPELHIVGDPTAEGPWMTGALLCALLAAIPEARITIGPGGCRVIVRDDLGLGRGGRGATPCEAFGRALLVAWGPA